MEEYVIQKRQSFFDLAIQFYGDLSRASEIAAFFNLPVTGTPPYGTIFTYTEGDNNIAYQFSLRKYFPASMPDQASSTRQFNNSQFSNQFA